MGYQENIHKRKTDSKEIGIAAIMQEKYLYILPHDEHLLVLDQCHDSRRSRHLIVT